MTRRQHREGLKLTHDRWEPLKPASKQLNMPYLASIPQRNSNSTFGETIPRLLVQQPGVWLSPMYNGVLGQSAKMSRGIPPFAH
jgi:hypothetical protein